MDSYRIQEIDTRYVMLQETSRATENNNEVYKIEDSRAHYTSITSKSRDLL